MTDVSWLIPISMHQFVVILIFSANFVLRLRGAQPWLPGQVFDAVLIAALAWGGFFLQ